MSEKKSGCFCGAINKQLIVSTCPLSSYACMWKHRQTAQCKFTTQELNPVEFAERVGLPPPMPSQVDSLKTAIVEAIKSPQL